MRILVASPYLPWPLNSGGNAAQFSTFKCLADDHQFTLVCPIFTEAATIAAQELQAQLPQVKIRAVYCGERAPSQPSARRFLAALARRTIRYGKRLLAPPPPRTPQSNGLFYPFDPLPEAMIRVLDEELAKGVDVCQAEFAETLSLGTWFPPHVPSLFIHHQIHFVYAQRSLDTGSRDGYSTYLATWMHAQERIALQHYNGVVTFSEPDRQALLPYVSPDKVFTSPFPIPADVGIARELPSGFDGRFLFVASEDHAPNRDALKWMLESIWPEILRQLPKSTLLVIGKWREETRASFAAPGVQFSGFVPDLTEVLRGGIMLVPLRVGSGIRVKIIVALAQGVPVISTAIGSEGMPLADGQEIMMRDRAPEFAAAAVEVARDPELWRRLTVAGKEAISRHYSPESVRQRRNEIYAALTRRG